MGLSGGKLDAFIQDGRPDWEAIDFEVHRSRCGYNLYTLQPPRCPECGLEFEWSVVLDASARRSDFLFEHHWRSRPIRSWALTVWRALRPIRFWRNVSIHDRIHAGPLWFLLFSAVVVFLVLFHGLAGLGWVTGLGLQRLAWRFGLMTSYQIDKYVAVFGAVAAVPLSFVPYYLLVSGGATVTVFLAALTLLCSLRQTLGRCRVRTIQVLRVVGYSATPVCAVWAVVSLSLITIQALYAGSTSPPFRVALGVAYPVVAAGVLAAYLVVGLKRYLHLPRATLLGITAAGVAFLFVYTVAIFVNVTMTIGWR